MITSESLAGLREEWATLYFETPLATPFTHPAWHELWLRHFGSNVAPVFLSVRVAEKLVGVVPLAMQRDGARLLGDAEICDYAGLLVADGAESVVARGALEWLTEDLTPRLEVWGLPADQPLTQPPLRRLPDRDRHLRPNPPLCLRPHRPAHAG